MLMRVIIATISPKPLEIPHVVLASKLSLIIFIGLCGPVKLFLVHSYIALFCAIRCGNLDLQLASIKCMVPVFTAFDRPTYHKALPQHLADCILLPPNILDNLKQGRV